MLFSCQKEEVSDNHWNISGIYPHLAYYNNEDECGTGAVVPWADRLWVITYGPHLPQGSSDKLYEITPDLKQIVRNESIGGTPANRMIHKESRQLFIGPYVIDENRNVKAFPYSGSPGRHTANARHLINPQEMIYLGTMEEGLYEINTRTHEVSTLFKDGNVLDKETVIDNDHDTNPRLPGAHGKGMYSGQGVLVYANNGDLTSQALEQFDIESGSLTEWDGENWNLVKRNQFCEVTGPGGIYGNANPETDPIWATGFDHKSLLLGVRDNGTWSFYRLPKASHTYDGAHGWNTEWPRIRDIGTPDHPDYLMTMHGLFWRFPGGFSSSNSGGIRPRSTYLKVIGDFARWRDQLVFGCDDSAQREFLNKRKAKGGIEGPGQSNSNIWFTSLDRPDLLGPSTASGAVWLEEEVDAGQISEPFLFTGWPMRSAWIVNHSLQNNELVFEVDQIGNGNWEMLRKEKLNGGESRQIIFSDDENGEWIRTVSSEKANLSVQYSYTEIDHRPTGPDEIFKGLLEVGESEQTSGLLYGLGNDRRALGISARYQGEDAGYYELNEMMELGKKKDPETKDFIDEKFAIPSNVISIERSSVLIIDDKDRRWRLPLGDQRYDDLINSAQLRISREVATERDLFSCHGTFYELPAENADGFAKIRPIASHNFRIHDYASYRGMLIMTGINPQVGKGNPHVIVSEDQKAAVWAGVIDDLWSLGKPKGKGGPWLGTKAETGIPSDPYLIGFYDKRSLSLKHGLDEKVTFTVEVDPSGQGPWIEFMEFEVSPEETLDYIFPDQFQARWIRFKVDKDCEATALLEYN
ncbi:MAG: hypothetical protein PVH48_03255 [Cyclobacteriaceae bacterium]